MIYEEIVDKSDLTKDEFLVVWKKFKEELSSGKIRVAEKQEEWHVNKWVKQMILLGMKYGVMTKFPDGTVDKDTLGNREFEPDERIRVTSGTACIAREGAYLAPTVCLMPPCYVNIGAYIDEGSMVDSCVVVGSCAQVGKNVHIGAGAILGGVLEPVGAMPVIIEDNVFLGADAKVTEGTIVKKGAIIGAGTTITASTPVYDVVNEKVITPNDNGQIVIPEGAVVVPGARQMDKKIDGKVLSVTTPIIIKYGAKVTLEELLR